MMGLVLKDYFITRKTIRYYVFIMVVYGFLSVLGTLPYSVMAGLVALLGMMLPITTFSYDDIAKWEKFVVATPAGRRGVIQEKYMFALLATLSAAVTVGAFLTICYFIPNPLAGQMEAWWEPLAVVGVCVCATLLMDSIFLPFLLKYGAEKARTISLCIFGVVFGGMALLAFLVDGGLTFSNIPEWVVAAVPVLLVVVTVAGLAVSYAVSLRVYGRKEM